MGPANMVTSYGEDEGAGPMEAGLLRSTPTIPPPIVAAEDAEDEEEAAAAAATAAAAAAAFR